MVLDIWKKKLLGVILKKLVDLVLNVIAEDRAGNPPANKDIVKRVIMSFVEVCFFLYTFS